MHQVKRGKKQKNIKPSVVEVAYRRCSFTRSPTVKLWLGNVRNSKGVLVTFGVLDTLSLTRGGRTWRFDCILLQIGLNRECWTTKTPSEGVALRTYALKLLQGVQFTSVDSVDKTIFCVFHSRTQHYWKTNYIIFWGINFQPLLHLHKRGSTNRS